MDNVVDGFLRRGTHEFTREWAVPFLWSVVAGAVTYGSAIAATTGAVALHYWSTQVTGGTLHPGFNILLVVTIGFPVIPMVMIIIDPGERLRDRYYNVLWPAGRALSRLVFRIVGACRLRGW